MMTYTIPWLFLSFGMIMMRTKAQSWYEMNLSVCKNGAVLLGNDNMIHLCAYLLFIWVSLTLIYAIAIFFQNICKDHGSQERSESEQCYFQILWII